MRKSRALLMVAAVLVPFLFTGWTASASRISSRATITRLRAEARGIDAEFLDTEMAVPGFAGVYLDSVTRKPVVMLTDQHRRRRAKIEMPRLLARRRHGAEALSFRQAGFTFSDLFGWKQEIGLALSRERALSYIGIDHRNNVVVIGLRPNADRQAFRARLSRLRIPLEAVELQASAGTRPMSNLANTVFSPNVSGEATLVSNNGYCSMGPIVKWGGGANTGFMSAGHCTDSYWGNSQSPTTYRNSATTQIGTEAMNPQPVTCPSGVIAEDSGAICRYSDVALIELASGQQASFGNITHTTGFNSLTVGGSMAVVDSEPVPLQGQYVALTGTTSGFVAGLVYLNSVTTNFIGTHRFVLNSVWIEGDTAKQGDSGGPVWTLADNTYCNATACYPWPTAVRLAGLVFGGITTSTHAHDGWVYSPIDNIVYETGALQIRNVASGDGGPLVAGTLLAPYPVYANDTHGYSLFATGGTLPFTCDWSIDNSVVATGESCTNWQWTNGGSDFTVSVVLRDAASHSTSGAVNVTIYSCNPPEDECVMEDFQQSRSSAIVGGANALLHGLRGSGAPAPTLPNIYLGPGQLFQRTPRVWLR